jgi:hypothetical protein
MLISDHTLLLAIGFSALCVVVMFIVTWFSTRSEPFLLTWAAGTSVIVFSAFGFAVYNVDMTPWVGTITFTAMVIGLGTWFSAAIQFRTGQLPFLITGPVILLGVLAVANAMFSGYNGLAIMIGRALPPCSWRRRRSSTGAPAPRRRRRSPSWRSSISRRPRSSRFRAACWFSTARRRWSRLRGTGRRRLAGRLRSSP